MLTSKQRAQLKSMANGMDPIFSVGKSGVTPQLVNTVSEALEARELIKVHILPNCEEEPEEAALVLSERTRAELVQVIGKKAILFRRSKTKPAIELV